MRRLATFVFTLGIATGTAQAVPGDDIYARPGIVATSHDGAHLNFICLGSGSPTVVFDAGYSDWSPAWAVVQPRVAAFTRACSYDRAGSGLSGPGPKPRTTERIATDLHDALLTGGIAGPYVFVGSAFGGDHIRAFADLYPSEVAGLVLVDADASDVDTSENRRADDEGDRDYVPDLKQCRDAIAAGRTDFALAAPPGRPARKCAQMFFRGLPEREWSAKLNAKVLDITSHKVALT